MIRHAAALSGVRSMHRSSDILARFQIRGRPVALAHPKTGSETSVTVLIPTSSGSASAEHKSVWRKRRKGPETSGSAAGSAGTDHEASAPCHSDSWPAADLVRNLALEELAMLEVAVEGAVFDDDVAAKDGRGRPGRHHMAFPGRVVGLVQVGGRDLLFDPGLQQHDIGVGADRQR